MNVPLSSTPLPFPIYQLTLTATHIGDIAVDWIGNNLYWTESRNQRIVVMDLDSMYTATLLKARPSETFKAIVVDPNRR